MNNKSGSGIKIITLNRKASFNYFFRDLIKEKFSSKFHFLINKFKENELLYFIIYRFIGGIPFAISNLLPTLFNIKT